MHLLKSSMIFKSFQLFIFVVFCFANKASSQQYKFSLNYEEFGVFFSPQKCIDTINFNLKGKYQGYTLRLYLKDCKGEASFELFDNKNDLQMSGNYDNAMDTLKKYKFGRYLGESEGTEKYSISLIKYLYPLKAREWIYYEGKGKQRKKRVVNYTYIIE